jgi:hypothetical protein
VHGLCWWENINKTKTLFILSSLRHIEQDKVDVMRIVYSYNMGDKIRRMRMNVAFDKKDC